MTARHIRAGKPPPDTPSIGALGGGVAQPHARDVALGEADEPRVAVAAGRARLARRPRSPGRPPARSRRGPPPPSIRRISEACCARMTRSRGRSVRANTMAPSLPRISCTVQGATRKPPLATAAKAAASSISRASQVPSARSPASPAHVGRDAEASRDAPDGRRVARRQPHRRGVGRAGEGGLQRDVAEVAAVEVPDRPPADAQGGVADRLRRPMRRAPAPRGRRTAWPPSRAGAAPGWRCSTPSPGSRARPPWRATAPSGRITTTAPSSMFSRPPCRSRASPRWRLRRLLDARVQRGEHRAGAGAERPTAASASCSAQRANQPTCVPCGWKPPQAERGGATARRWRLARSASARGQALLLHHLVDHAVGALHAPARGRGAG